MKEKTAISCLIQEIEQILSNIKLDKETTFRILGASIRAKKLFRQQMVDFAEYCKDNIRSRKTPSEHFTEKYES